MINPIIQLEAEVADQVKVAEGSFILSLKAPLIAKQIKPGQFIQIQCIRQDSGGGVLYDPLLPRPFSIYRIRRKEILDILYEVVGRGTQRMSEARTGDRLHIFGPLGNTFSYPKERTLSFLVGGGVGLAPFYDLAAALIDPKRGKQKREDVVVLLGARNKKKVFCEKDFRALGVRFEIATDDGSSGFHGLVTQLLEKELRHEQGRNIRLYACGPKAMLHAVAQISGKRKTPCEISIDAHMPCGYGICFGCAVAMNHGGLTYKLACTDGPVFQAKELLWDP